MNKKAAERFYNEYYRNVYGQCLKALRCKEDAEDVASVSIHKAIKNIKKFHGRCKLSCWIYAVTRNEIGMFLRRKKANVIQGFIEDYNDLTIPSYELLTDPLLRRLIIREVNRLPIQWKAAVILSIFQQVTNKEAAAILGDKVPAQKSKLNRGRSQLKQELARTLEC